MGDRMKTLETERLILRLYTEDDLDDFYEYASVEGVGEMAGWPHHKSKEETKQILDYFIKSKNVYALYHKQDKKVIGSLGIHNSEQQVCFGDNQKEIGYVLSKDYWNQGLMPEAVKEVIKYCFEELNIDTLWCAHFDINTRSKRVIEKCGFTLYGHYEKYFEQLGKTFQGLKYYLKKENYNQTKK